MSEKKITPNEAEVGMILSRALPDAKGRIILNKGGRLTPSHIKRLETWGISEIFIDSTDEAEKEEAESAAREESAADLLDKDFLAEMAIVFNKRFTEVKDNSLMEKIKKAAFKTVILSGRNGIPALETKIEN